MGKVKIGAEIIKENLLLPFQISTTIFDYLERHWKDHNTHRKNANVLILVFLCALAVIELNRLHLLPAGFAGMIPTNHFYAVKLAFDLLLIIEIFDLLFGLANSVADAMGKQFEILSLILLRQSFKEFAHFTEPLEWADIAGSVFNVLSDAGGALVIFWLVLIFYRLQKHKKITTDEHDFVGFVAVKKTISLGLLGLFILVGIHDCWTWYTTGEGYSFFSVFFLIMIFSDILMVLVSLRYSNVYGIVFRNSGFAVATVLIRLTLTAPPFINVLLGIASVGLGIGLTMAYNYFQQLPISNPPEKFAD